MKNLFSALIIIMICLSFSHCASNNNNPVRKTNNISVSPKFSDNGKAIDSLRKVYHFEDVEYENWEDDDNTDSSLTISFINSKKIPDGNLEASVDEFRNIASGIHGSLADQNKYRSYYIIFIERDTVMGKINSAHTSGMDIHIKDLYPLSLQ